MTQDEADEIFREACSEYDYSSHTHVVALGILLSHAIYGGEHPDILTAALMQLGRIDRTFLDANGLTPTPKPCDI